MPRTNILSLTYEESPTLRAERKRTLVDWKKVKTEYITSTMSYRKLCEKFDIPFNTLQCRAKKEKWVELRKSHQDKIVAKSVEKAEESAIDYKSAIYDLAYKVAGQLNELTDSKTILELVKIGIKPRDITGAIKDLEDALHVKSMADMQEQEARIKNLRKQSMDDAPKEITVHIQGDANDYSK
jgi:hypothetical protein